MNEVEKVQIWILLETICTHAGLSWPEVKKEAGELLTGRWDRAASRGSSIK